MSFTYIYTIVFHNTYIYISIVPYDTYMLFSNDAYTYINIVPFISPCDVPWLHATLHVPLHLLDVYLHHTYNVPHRYNDAGR